jgi:hypothetical protein
MKSMTCSYGAFWKLKSSFGGAGGCAGGWGAGAAG